MRGGAPIFLEASRSHAVLILHGFNDTPNSVAPLARALHEKGWTVDAPLLPAHGRGLAEATTYRAEALVAYTRGLYEQLARRYSHVAVIGQSMGGALAVLLAAKHPTIPALVLLAPYLGMPHGLQLKVALGRLGQPAVPYLRSVGGERSIHDPVARRDSNGLGVVTASMLIQLRRIAVKAARDLPKVKVPTLYMQSREDNRIAVEDAERFFSMLGARKRELHWLTGCGHVIAVDYCREEVARRVHDWLVAHTGEPTPRAMVGGS